jgi:hypothetical protein
VARSKDPGSIRRRLVAPLQALALMTASSGCVDTEWWQGGESAVLFGWTVNGGPPATACAAVRGAEVRLWIAQALPSCTLETESCGIRIADWAWDCPAGTASTGLRFANVAIYVGWTLVDDSGAVLAWTPWQSASLGPGDNFLGTQDFVP